MQSWRWKCLWAGVALFALLFLTAGPGRPAQAPSVAETSEERVAVAVALLREHLACKNLELRAPRHRDRIPFFCRACWAFQAADASFLALNQQERAAVADRASLSFVLKPKEEEGKTSWSFEPFFSDWDFPRLPALEAWFKSQRDPPPGPEPRPNCLEFVLNPKEEVWAKKEKVIYLRYLEELAAKARAKVTAKNLEAARAP